jgi:hypothetical protein
MLPSCNWGDIWAVQWREQQGTHTELDQTIKREKGPKKKKKKQTAPE